MQHRRAWGRPVASILVLALLVSSAPAAAARSNLPPVEPIHYTLDASMLPAGTGVTPLSAAELQEVDGQMIQAFVIGGRLAVRAAVRCARSAACRRTVTRIARATVKVARGGFEVLGAKYTYDEFRRRHSR